METILWIVGAIALLVSLVTLANSVAKKEEEEMEGEWVIISDDLVDWDLYDDGDDLFEEEEFIETPEATVQEPVKKTAKKKVAKKKAAKKKK